ncbi:MAG: ATP-binding protein [Clostridiales bacterium]|nr:ATP-binding protein [Clostridiales bacterium]
MLGKRDAIDNTRLHTAPYSHVFTLNGQKMVITVKDALYRLSDDIIISNMLEDIAGAVHKHSTKYNPLPASIIISHGGGDSETGGALGKGTQEGKPDKPAAAHIIRSFAPRWKLDDVCVDEAVRSQILSALTIINNQGKLYTTWGLGKIFKQNRSIVLNFYGKSGTGKSMMAEAIAGYLGKTVYQVNYAELESKYVGETPKNIVEAFKQAQADNSVLVFDEADSFLGKRLTNVSQSADYGVNITRSVMLMEIENYEGVVVFTTNLISNYDEAFKRRIFASVEFHMPDAKARKRIWATHIPAELPLAGGITPRLLGERYDGVSGADIKDMLMGAAAACIQGGGDVIGLEHFDTAHQYIKSRYAGGGQFVETQAVSTEVITKEQYETEMAKAGDGHGG